MKILCDDMFHVMYVVTCDPWVTAGYLVIAVGSTFLPYNVECRDHDHSTSKYTFLCRPIRR
jgi:hypothetical protein